ncbi:MAG: response regulator, partial [Gammaproteobacteria bacterium]
MKRESFEVEKDATSSVSLSPASTENGRGAAAVSQLVAHILVIDDEPMICQQLERLYTQTGHRVTTTNRVENALEYLANEDVDLVITDMRLPGLSGVDLIRRIQERWPDVPVIVMTGYAHIESAVEVLKLGASDYIVKPFSAAAIQESSHAILEKARIFTEIRHLRRELK